MAVIVRMPSKGGSNTKNVTAVPDDVLSGKVFVNSKGEEQEGNMPDNGAVAQALNAGGSYVIPKGYHDGNGKVTANSLAAQTQATATADTIGNGKTAWVNGNKVTGKAVLASEINGVKKEYYVYAGQNVKAGDFVQLTSGVSGVGAGVSTWNTIGSSRDEIVDVTIQINDQYVLYGYYENNNYKTYYLKLVKIDGIDVSVGPAVALPLYNTTSSYIPFRMTLCVMVVDSSHFYVIYRPMLAETTTKLCYNYCTISGTSISISAAKTLVESNVFMLMYNCSCELPKISEGVYACIGVDNLSSISNTANRTYYVEYLTVNNSSKTISVKTSVSTGYSVFSNHEALKPVISNTMIAVRGYASSGGSSDSFTYVIHAAINELTLTNINKQEASPPKQPPMSRIMLQTTDNTVFIGTYLSFSGLIGTLKYKVLRRDGTLSGVQALTYTLPNAHSSDSGWLLQTEMSPMNGKIIMTYRDQYSSIE